MNSEEKILNLLTQIQNQINTLENKVDSNHIEVINGLNEIKSQVQELEGTNATNHVIINTKLNKVMDDLDFLTYKELQAEKEMYNIKKRLIRQKRNIR